MLEIIEPNPCNLRVLPTRVGMVRTGWLLPRSPSSSPHPRGDGPIRFTDATNIISFSPPAWGWSGRLAGLHGRIGVLPTRVGMVRILSLTSGNPLGSPHPRGDGPMTSEVLVVDIEFSPPAWGWSATFRGRKTSLEVLPTRVGMVRTCGLREILAGRSPHPRGDGPCSSFTVQFTPAFSPPAWGWSAGDGCQFHSQRVLPTRVGMVRISLFELVLTVSSPHPRGDGPPCSTNLSPLFPFSPPAWGWSEPIGLRGDPVLVLPTRVGMVRFQPPVWRNLASSPHPRGDGPHILKD